MPVEGNMMDVAETSFLIELPYPEYDSSWDEEEEEAMLENFFEIETSSFMSDGSSTDAWMSFSVSFNATAEYDQPDLLMIRIETDAPAEQLASGVELIQWAQFRLSTAQDDEPYQKVACSSVVGGDASQVSIQTRVGTTGFDDDTVDSA